MRHTSTMSPLNPTYLLKSRHGIFYCRVRIPLSIKKQYNTTRNEIKRSLNTRDYSVALRAAKHLWVELENTDYTMKDTHDAIELADQEASDGRKLLKKFLIASIESKETGILEGEDVDNFFVDYVNSESEIEILFKKLNPRQTDLLYKQLDLWGEVAHDKKKEILLKLKEELESSTTILVEPSVATQPNQLTPSNAPVTPLLTDGIEDYIQHYITLRKRGKNPRPISKDTIGEYRGILKEFIRIIDGDNLKCSDLTKQLVIRYDENIWKVPVSLMNTNIYKGKSIKSVIAMGKKTKSNETISKHIMIVKKFLQWTAKEEYTTTGLDAHFERIGIEDKPVNEKRNSFNPEELHKLFNNDIYEKGFWKGSSIHLSPERYWLPLIALFTGMRGREIAQLYADDVQLDKESDIWFIEVRFNLARKQWRKNVNAGRKIPVHRHLKKLGFIDLVENTEKKSLIFPNLYHESGNPYKNWGNNFNRKTESGWKWKLGVKGNTVFHSFRHNVIDYLEKANVHKRPGCFLVGQKYEGGFVSNYIKRDDLVLLNKVINVLSFPSIDWKNIPKRRW